MGKPNKSRKIQNGKTTTILENHTKPFKITNSRKIGTGEVAGASPEIEGCLMGRCSEQDKRSLR